MLDVVIYEQEKYKLELLLKQEYHSSTWKLRDNFGKCMFSQCLQRGCLDTIVCAE